MVSNDGSKIPPSPLLHKCEVRQPCILKGCKQQHFLCHVLKKDSFGKLIITETGYDSKCQRKTVTALTICTWTDSRRAFKWVDQKWCTTPITKICGNQWPATPFVGMVLAREREIGDTDYHCLPCMWEIYLWWFLRKSVMIRDQSSECRGSEICGVLCESI